MDYHRALHRLKAVSTTTERSLESAKKSFAKSADDLSQQLEQSKHTFPRYSFLFDQPGVEGFDCDEVNNPQCLVWDPSYYDPANLATAPTSIPTGSSRRPSRGPPGMKPL